MSYKHVGTAGDLVRFRCSLKVGIEDDRRTVHLCGAAWTWNGVKLYEVHGNRQLTQLARRLKYGRWSFRGAVHWRVSAGSPSSPTGRSAFRRCGRRLRR